MVKWTPTESSCGTDPETLNNTSSLIENVGFERFEIFLDLSWAFSIVSFLKDCKYFALVKNWNRPGVPSGLRTLFSSNTNASKSPSLDTSGVHSNWKLFYFIANLLNFLKIRFWLTETFSHRSSCKTNPNAKLHCCNPLTYSNFGVSRWIYRCKPPNRRGFRTTPYSTQDAQDSNSTGEWWRNGDELFKA